MKRYTLSVTSPEYWSEIHGALIVDSNKDGIPDRKVTCSDSKGHSPTRGTYELTETEATEIGNHPHVKWIELSPTDNPESYPTPQPRTKRFSKAVKVYRDLSRYGGTNNPPSSPTIAEEHRTNWAVRRVGVNTLGDSWPVGGYYLAPIITNIDYSLTGKNVDVIIFDSGILAAHPDFLDADGKSRVRDIVLDGPYYIDKSYFDSNNHTFTRPDGRIGISTTSAHAWWENSSSRSGAFSSIGTIAINSNYTEAKSIGVGGTIHSITDTHGTMVASLAAGNDFGIAFEANIWNMSAISDPTGTTVETAYDLIKLFHQNKPINSITGRKNPTVVNGSWGYVAGIRNATDTVSYRFSGNTGSFTANSTLTTATTPANLARALVEGLLGAPGVHKMWSASSGSNSTNTAGKEMIDSGVIHVVAAGNDNQRISTGSNDPHRLDYLSDTYTGGGANNIYSDFPSGVEPVGHRDFIHPANVGFDASVDPEFHPTIQVGVISYLAETDGSEFQTYYSNNGPGIDIFAPGDSCISAGLLASNGTKLSSSDTIYNRYNSDFKDQYMNGTSAASPVCAGVVALYLESVPGATSRDVKDFLNDQGKVEVGQGILRTESPNTGIGTTGYWSYPYNLRGARRRILRDRSASSTIPSVKGVAGGESIITDNLELYLDAGNPSSYSGSGSTWTDLSGSGNNFSLVNSPTFSSDNGGQIILNGTNQYAVSANNISLYQFGTNDYSYGVWAKVNSTADNESLLSSSTEQGGVTPNSWQFDFGGTDQKIRHVFRHTSGQVISYTNTQIGSVFKYLVVVNDRSEDELKIYVDGILIDTEANTNYRTTDVGNYSSSSGSNGVFRVGSNRGQNAFIDGSIAQVHVYKGKALSASEVLHNFDVMKIRYLDQPFSFSGISFKQS